MKIVEGTLGLYEESADAKRKAREFAIEMTDSTTALRDRILERLKRAAARAAEQHPREERSIDELYRVCADVHARLIQSIDELKESRDGMRQTLKRVRVVIARDAADLLPRFDEATRDRDAEMANVESEAEEGLEETLDVLDSIDIQRAPAGEMQMLTPAEVKARLARLS